MRRIIIQEQYGIFTVGADGRFYSARTLEAALGRAAPRAPEDYLLHAAEVLEGLLPPKDENEGQFHDGVVSA